VKITVENGVLTITGEPKVEKRRRVRSMIALSEKLWTRSSFYPSTKGQQTLPEIRLEGGNLGGEIRRI
jgi:hypothetical protein